MPNALQLEILPQPDDTTCGPTCLHALYRYYDDPLSLDEVIRETPSLEDGGTLAVLLASHALRRGYRATIYTYNLKVFDPTWFQAPVGGGDPSSQPSGGQINRQGPAATPELVRRLQAQIESKDSAKLQSACKAYIEFLQLGGQLRMQDLNGTLIRGFLQRSIPILTGLSSTYLYQCEREVEADGSQDDVRGEPTGHFVVLCGYDAQNRSVQVADPFEPNPLGEKHDYEVAMDRLICAILLGVLTYDANLLIIQPNRESHESRST